MQMNKQGTLSCKNVLSLHERHWSGHNRGLVASQQDTRMFSSKNPDKSLKTHVHCPYMPPTLCISIVFMTSLSDIMIVCFPLPEGKTLHMHRRTMLGPLHTHWHPHWLFFYSYTWTISWILYPEFQVCDTCPQVFQCALIPEPKIYWDNMLKWLAYINGRNIKIIYDMRWMWSAVIQI